MACRITLPIWPSSLDCIKWSKDNCIAIGAGDQVAILTPRFRDQDQNGSCWIHTTFKTNLFTAEEVPLTDPLSFKSFSAGEELSLRHVHALDWSSPGLSRFGGCVLAVLSSNHVLSFWECEGRPDVPSNWRRKIIVNHAIKSYYDRSDEVDGATEQEKREAKQVQQRVRAFEWSSPVFGNGDIEEANLAPHIDSGTQYLAVSTEGGDILLLRVQSPYKIISPSTNEWKVEVVDAINVHQLASGALGSPIPVRGSGNRVLTADHLAWGTWKRAQERLHSDLACISDSRLFCVYIEADNGIELPEFRREGIYCKQLIPSRSDITGPCQFVPGTDLLTAFAADAIFCIDTSNHFTRDNDFTQHHLDGRWDEISGATFSKKGKNLPCVHVASHLPSGTAVTAVLALPLDPDTALPRPAWRDAIEETKTAFSAQYNLDGHVMERVWGIAASHLRLGGYVVTATTMLPSDSLAYTIQSDQQATINITRETDLKVDKVLRDNDGTVLAPDFVAETLLFSLQRYLESQSGPVDREPLVQAMLKTSPNSKIHFHFEKDRDLPSDISNTPQVVQWLTKQIYMHQESVNARLRLLVDRATRKVSNVGQISPQIIQRLVAVVLQLSAGFEQGGEMSKKIRSVYKVVKSKLEPNLQSSTTNADVETWSEECRICRSDVPFESVKWARCEAGHQFSRCALTFFAIQEPGISKQCTICRLQYLNEWLLLKFMALEENGEGVIAEENSKLEDIQAPDLTPTERSSTAAVEPESSLARVLFAAINRCIYCGGRFVA